MKAAALIISVLSLLCITTSCGPDSRARNLLKKTNTLIDQARLAENEDPETAAALYQQAEEQAQNIIVSMGETATGKSLSENAPVLRGLSLSQLRGEVLPALRQRALAQKDPLACAEYLVGRVSAPQVKARLLQIIAHKLLSLNQAKMAQEYLLRTLAAVQELSSAREKIDWYIALILDFANAGSKDRPLQLALEALSLAQQLTPGAERASALQNVAETYFELAAEDKALAALQSITDPAERRMAVEALAKRLTERSLYHEALAASSLLPNAEERARFLVALAEKNAEKNLAQPTQLFLAAALELLPILSDSPSKADLMLGIGRIYRRANQSDQALLQMRDAAALLKDAGPAQVELLSRLANEQASNRQRELAVATVTRALQILKGAPRSDERDAVLLGLAIALARSRYLDRAGQLVLSLKSDFYRTLGLVELAEVYSGQERRSEAQALLEQAKTSFNSIASPEEKMKALLCIRDAYMKLGRYAEAIRITVSLRNSDPAWKDKVRALSNTLIEADEKSAARSLALALEDPYFKGVILTDLARSYVSRKDFEEGLNLVNQVLEIAQTGGDIHRNLALIEYTLDLLIQMSQLSQAQSLLESHPIANSSLWLVLVANAYAEVGQRDSALSVLRKAAKQTAGMDSPSDKIRVLTELGYVYAKLGAPADLEIQNALKEILRASSRPSGPILTWSGTAAQEPV